VDVADIPVMIIVGQVEGRQSARGSDVATRGGGGATQNHSLSTCHPDGAPVLLEERRAGDKTPGCAADNQEPQNSLLPVCWIGRKSSARVRRGCGPR
jgi:hypothetical protein